MHSVILKNDAVGDLVHSISAIYNITTSNENGRVTIFLSKLNERFSFLVKRKNVYIKVLNYHLNIIEKFKIIFFLFKNKIDKVYILSPKNFYFFLPLIFRKVKFYAICINNINNYKRPNLFLRKFLFSYEINDREKIFKRDSIKLLQERLTTKGLLNSDFKFNLDIKTTKKLTKHLPKNYIYFHYKKKICDDLGWGFDELQILFKEFSNYYEHVVFTRDIKGWDQFRGEKSSNMNILKFKDIFNSYDFKSDKFIDNRSNIMLIDNVVGEDLFNILKNSKKIIAFHGMMTLLGNLLKKNVLDLWHSKINSWDDYRSYRNAFYEFKPKNNSYDFIIPKKNINKTINKIKFALMK